MRYACFVALGMALAAPAYAQDAPSPAFTAEDLFGLSVAADPQISPDGKWVAYTVGTTDLKEEKS